MFGSIFGKKKKNGALAAEQARELELDAITGRVQKSAEEIQQALRRARAKRMLKEALENGDTS